MDKETENLLVMKDKLQLLINKTEKPNSFEVGKTGSRFKIYFDTAEDLKSQVDALKKAGFNIDQKEENE